MAGPYRRAAVHRQAERPRAPQLTHLPGNSFNGAWSPGGSKIVFARNRTVGREADLYTMNADGTRVRRITRTPKLRAQWPDWRPPLRRQQRRRAAARDITAPLYAKMKQRFTTTKPGAWTGWSTDRALKPFPPGAQPPPARGETLVFPRGTRFDLTGGPNCTASDEEIVRDGLGACPKRSRVGSGEASVHLGAAGNLDLKVYEYLARPGFAYVFTTDSGSVLRVVRSTVQGNRLTITIPRSAPPGGYEPAVTRFSLTTRRAGARKRPLLRTPPRCPQSGRWTFTYLARYDEPYGVQRSTSTMPCARRRARPTTTSAGGALTPINGSTFPEQISR